MADKIYSGTVGLVVKIDMGEIISAATDYSLMVKKPNGTTATWTPTIGTPTMFYYTTGAGELDAPGAYVIQPQFTLGAWSGLGWPVKLRVYPAIA